MFRCLRDNRGFSLVEMILALVMGAMVVGVTSESLLNNVDSYTLISNRKSALGDVRTAMNRISFELLRVNTSDLNQINGTSIYFDDATGTATNFRLAASTSGNLGLYRGNDLLIDKVSSFALIYYDQNGNALAPIDGNRANVRRMKYTVTTDPVGDEGSLTLSTVVTPRDFIGYTNYQ